MKYYLFIVFTIFFAFINSGCGKKPETQTQPKPKTGSFSWKNELTSNDIPDTPIKCFILGKEINFSYIVCERWHGSNDNVIRFSIFTPDQPCGFIDKFQGIEITRKSKNIELGNYEKRQFGNNFPDFQVRYIIDSGNGTIIQFFLRLEYRIKDR